MDPNPWNTYNLQYGHSASGGLPPTHTPLNRLDLTQGLSLSHTLQATHGSLGGRSVHTIPGVNYQTLGVPILDPLATGISAPQSHKTMSLAQSQLVFDPQVRVSAEQQSPTISRYDSSKAFRTDVTRDAMARNQLLEAAAARVWGTTNFSSSSLYNQFGSLLSDVAATTATTLASPPGGGSNSSAVSKSSQPQMHEPPPAHSSNTARLSIQRNPHSSELLYGRSSESLIPSSLAQFGSLYNPTAVGKQSQQQQLQRQTPVHIQPGFSTHSDIEDLSSNSQNQLYGPYANLSVSDSQDFSAAQLSGEMSYEAVSPAPPLNESAQTNPEHNAFSIVQFPDLANLTSEHAHTLADKFQENDFRLKMDSRVEPQQHQDALASPHSTPRQDLGTPLKIPKDMPNLQSTMLSMQMNQRSGQFQPNMAMSQSMSQVQPGNLNMSQLNQHTSLTTSSMQQPPAPIPVQALADSTTKPKRSRSRKKKGDPNPPASNNPVGENKKSNPPQASTLPQQQQGSHPPPHILNMPPTSQHISTLPMGSHVSQNSQIQQQQQQQGYRPGSNQFTSRDAQRAQTPSMPQNYSVQDHQGHGYTPVQSPKLPNQNVIRSHGEFVLPGRVTNDKSSTSAPYKQQQRKSSDSTPKSNSVQSNQIYSRSNIPESPQHMQNFAGHSNLMGNSGQQRGSPMQDTRVGMARIQNFDNSPQQKLASHMSPLGQPSPQGNVSDASNFSTNKINSSQMMGPGVMVSQPAVTVSQSPMGSRSVSVEPTAMSHGYEQGHQPALIENQDPNQFSIDFGGQPFLEQLVGVQPPMAIPSTSFSHGTSENGEVVFTTLVTPAENARLQQQQQQPQDSASNDNSFRPTYHGEAVHEIRPIGPIGGHLGMEDVPFNAFFDNQREMEQQGTVAMQPQDSQEATPEPDRMSLTFVPQVVEDDELSHFNQLTMTQPVPMVKKEPQDTRDVGPKPAPKDSFQNSFLSYLQGHKQETLSSVSSSAVTKKPQLPKYIPEPRRPRPPQPKESVQFSDAEDGSGPINNKIKDLMSNLSDNDNSSQKSESDKEGYSVQRTSELAVKITLPKNKKKSKFGPFAESSLLKDTMRKNREGMLKRKRKKGKHRDSEGEEYLPGNLSDDEIGQRQDLQTREPSPPPLRTSIGRKAKDKCMEKTKKRKKHSGSDSSSEEILTAFVGKGKGKGGYKSDDSDKNYDSDKDPIWMPFEVDLKPGHQEFDEKRKKPKRPRVRTSSSKSGKGLGSHKSSSSGVLVGNNASSLTDSSSGQGEKSSNFKVGMFVIEKKDLQNYELYPIWRLEPNNMIRKFEMKVEGGVIRHQAVGTFSTWMSSMENQFQLIKVREVPGKTKGESGLVVEVLEECRPKPPSDGRLELQYENDPIVEPFNIYLQVFLSQALEPTFLSAILETNEKFYVDALTQIDGMIDNKCQSIAKLAHWKASFQECLHRCPLMKEIDRPNLKQACQASENSSPPTIKSVLLSGNSYDRFLLKEQPSSRTDVAQEFMIGKVAAYYVRTYHSLYHFKYWLRQRCEAKVKMMKESNKSDNLTDEVILDKCLENRNWVLQLFDNFKTLLKYGGEAPR